jgi:hypothetical protein
MIHDQETERAAVEGAVAACRGLPLHTVADTSYGARSRCGDAWERGWGYATDLCEAVKEGGNDD